MAPLLTQSLNFERGLHLILFNSSDGQIQYNTIQYKTIQYHFISQKYIWHLSCLQRHWNSCFVGLPSLIVNNTCIAQSHALNTCLFSLLDKMYSQMCRISHIFYGHELIETCCFWCFYNYTLLENRYIPNRVCHVRWA